MDNAWIGLIGVVGGVVIANVFLLVDKYVERKIKKSERWIEDKKQAYIDFVLSADIYFKYGLSVLAGRPSAERDGRIANAARKDLNKSMAVIGIVGGDKVVREAEIFEKWIHDTIISLDVGLLSDDDSQKYKTDFIKRKKKFISTTRKDFPA